MSDAARQSPKSKSRGLDWILWWRLDPAELDKQVSQYGSLRIYQSARGIAFLALLFSAVITVLFINFLGMSRDAYFDAAIMLVVGFFIWRGHRWAMITGMVLWTVEKAFQVIPSAPSEHVPNVVVLLIWWTAYMHAFWLALRVEFRRRSKTLHA